MTPRDIAGRLEIHALFPWLEHLAPAGEAPEPAAAAIRTAPPAATATKPADLPRAA